MLTSLFAIAFALTKTIKKIFFLALIALSVLTLERFCHKHTDGFSVSKIRKSFTDQSIQMPIPDSVHQILEQPLRYIGRGGQCYAFSTADEKYVVKLLKYNNNYPRIWFSISSFPFGLEIFRQKKLAKKQKKLQGEYKSYQIAREELASETGILYFHLNQGSLPKATLLIEDKLGIVHTLAADKYQFYIQKKGSPFYPELRHMIEQKQFEIAREAISELVTYLFKRCKKKITDGDDGIYRNFAFQNGHPFQIDIGQFSYNDSLCSEKDYQKDLMFFTKDFRNWLEKNSPALAEHLVNSIHEITVLKEGLIDSNL